MHRQRKGEGIWSGETDETLRLCAAVLWCLLAVLCFGLARRHRLFAVCGAIASVFGALRATRSSPAVLRFGQELLHDLGIYQQRIYVKIGIAVVGAALVAWLAWRFGRRFWQLPMGLRMCLFAQLAAVAGTAAMAASLDNFMPSFLLGGTKRRIIELTLWLIAFVGTVCVRVHGGPPEGTRANG